MKAPKSFANALVIVPLLMAASGPATGLEGAPRAVYPSGPVAEVEPQFSWTPVDGAVSYRLNVHNAVHQVAFNRRFTAEETNCGANEQTCTAQADEPFHTGSYRWRVNARGADGSDGGWSDWTLFYPGQDSVPGPPPAPVALTPQGTVDSAWPEFSWEPSEDAFRYRVKIVDDNNRLVFNFRRNAPVLGCRDGLSDCIVVSPRRLAPGSYRWKVLARNTITKTKSAWSAWRSFEVPEPAALGSGLDARPQNPSCTLPEPPPRVSPVRAERVYPNLPSHEAVILLSMPPVAGMEGHWVMVEKDGEVTTFDATDPQANSLDLYLDITDRTISDTGETGLLGMAFHPDFPTDNRAFLFYTNFVGGAYESYLSEFRSPDGGHSLNPASEKRLLTITGHASHNHKGGTVAFGPDGYLYLGLGDGGSRQEAQNRFSLFGSLLRIDIDHDDPYAIPPDNPFADGVDALPEIYAYGLRNPWRWSFDPESGVIWLTDVGLSSWEEINLIEPGGNYGWPIVEGPDCLTEVDCDRTGLIPPLFAYPHDATGGFVVVGGYVYRGSAFPELQGTFIYADGGDKVWALLFDDEGEPESQVLIDGGLQGAIIRSLFEDEDGEIYLVKPGPLYRLVAGEDAPDSEFPTTLSATGCVDPAEPTRVAQGLIPYDVNSAFWTDGAAKSRWMALPDGGTIGLDDAGDFQFPPGTVLMKEFRLFDRRVETRLFARHDDGDWAGYTYAWNDDETDAELVGPSGSQIEVEGQSYTLPGRSQCLQCHTEIAGRSLGLELHQLNSEITYPSTGRLANQLTTLEAIALLDRALPDDPENLPALAAIHDDSATISDRARAYLHTNCSGCHRPEGPGRGPADLRFQPLEFMNICDVAPQVGDFGIEDARLLAPGEPERSIVAVRMELLGAGAMPPIGKNLVDIDATAVVEEYIAALESCPPAAR